MKRLPVRCGLSVLVGAAVVVLAPAAAGAATVGSVFAPSGYVCQGPIINFQTTSPADQYVVPRAGVLTAWSHQASNQPPASLKLEVGRETTPDQFLIVGNSVAKNPVANQLNTYTDIAIPVQPGDVLGLRSTGTYSDCGELTGGAGGYQVNYIGIADPAAWDTVSMGFTANVRLDISANLNEPPTASAGSDRDGVTGTSVSLDGGGSTDPDGDTLTYEWRQTAGPAVALSGPGTASPSFTAPRTDGALVFELDVCDPWGQCDTDSVEVVAKPAADDPPVETPPADSPKTGPPNAQPRPAKAAPSTALESMKVVGRKATFRFRSNERGATYLCKLDKGRFKKCKSPRSYKRLKPGKHVFRVKAGDAQGQFDRSPVVKRFKIKK